MVEPSGCTVVIKLEQRDARRDLPMAVEKKIGAMDLILDASGIATPALTILKADPE